MCGNVCVWKPSEKTPLCAIACQNIISSVLRENNFPECISSVLKGNSNIGKWMADDQLIALLSATGSTKMGRDVSQRVGSRLGKTLLELGGNNAIIITPNANIDTAIRASIFGAVGTCGQRCTSTRRLIVHSSIFSDFTKGIQKAYKQLKIGNPFGTKRYRLYFTI